MDNKEQLALARKKRQENRSMPAKQQRFLHFFYGEAMFDAAEAARLAGYSQPHQAANKLKKALAEVIEQRNEQIRAEASMSVREVQERLAAVARDTSHKDHVRALELVAKIHGLLSDKMTLNIDRKALLSELDSVIEKLAVQGKES